MQPEEYIYNIKEKFGEQRTKDGQLVRDLDDKDLIKRMLTRYPGDRDKIEGLDTFLAEEELPPDVPQVGLKGKIDALLDNDATRWITKNIPGGKLGEALGNSIEGFGRLAQGDLQGANEAAQANKANMGATIADTINAGGTILSAAAPITGAGTSNIAGNLGAGKGLQYAAGAGARIAESAGIGAGLAGSRAVAEGKDMEQVGEAAKTGAAWGAAIPAAGELVKGFGALLKGAGDKIQISVIKPNASDMADGFKLDTVKKYDLGGTLTQSFAKTESKLDFLTRELNKKIVDADPVDLTTVYKDTIDDLIKDKAKHFGTNTSVQGALEQLKGEIANLSDTGTVPAMEAQAVKRAAGHMGAWQFGMRDPDSTAREKVYNVFYTKLKEAIEKSAPDGVKGINKEISEIIPVMNAIIRRIPVAQRQNLLGLTDMISLATATVDPRALGVGLLNVASKSGLVGDALSKGGEALQKGVPAIGNALRAGATALPD